MSEQDVERWSREVAEDPGAPSFVRLARAHRRQGRRAAAREIVLRGLERNPEDIEAHALLALIHVEDGDRERARATWETVLRLAPDNFDAHRGLGFLALERSELEAAGRHLEVAARKRPDDPTVAEAREILDRRAATEAVAAGDASRLFEGLEGDAPFLGALVVDERGGVLAGSLLDSPGGVGELLGGMLNGVAEEAHRTAKLIELGEWEGLLVDCEQATLHVAPLPERAVVVVLAPPRTPAGWMGRMASQAHELARGFLEAAS